MRLYFSGHDCRYAAEQSLLMLFPGEKPEYPEGSPSGERCELRVSRGAKYTVCTALLVRSGAAFRGRAQAENPDPADEYALRGCENRLVKLAFYRAALASGLPKPEWGSLSGVRPAKLMDGYLREGLSPRAAKGRFMREYFVSGSRAQLCLDAALAAQEAARSLDERDVCLYVGIPFCPTRCAYCSFVSQSVEKSMKLMEPFLDALLLDIRATAAETRRAGLRPVALYMGGGTPTTLSAAQLDRLCAALEREFDLSALREYTVEAGRPDTITAEKLRVLRAHGVGRVSVNPQTMSDSVLEAIGRRHTAQDIVDALALVRECGGFEVNMDLIAGLPTDTAGGFSRTLDAVLSLAPENVTVHTLSLKRGSGLTLAGRPLPEAGEVRAMLDEAMERLAGSGYAPYYLYRQKNMAGGFENVGWTKPGSENLYNICIMEELCSILAMGAGAISKRVLPDRELRIRRAPNVTNVSVYIDRAEEMARRKEILFTQTEGEKPCES